MKNNCFTIEKSLRMHSIPIIFIIITFKKFKLLLKKVHLIYVYYGK